MGEPAPGPASTPFWRSPGFWGALSAIGTLLGLTCPFWPAPYNTACVAISQGIHKGSDVGRELAAPSSSSSSSAPPRLPAAECVNGQVQSVPNFCKCVDGAWRDYFDAGTPCGG